MDEVSVGLWQMCEFIYLTKPFRSTFIVSHQVTLFISDSN